VFSVSLIEYVLHRWVFHQVPEDHEDQMTHFIMHGYHHDFPNDRLRLVLPLAFILPLAAVFMGLSWLIVREDWLQLFAGIATGYMAYDWIHYYTHHFRPRRGIGKWLMQYHLLHHHDSPNHRFGITSPLWDFVFRTYLPLDARAREMHKDRARGTVD
jgi:sterol desaturase/sphingolipid hydroxylase (fatty acid hydroxylase superfamily)